MHHASFLFSFFSWNLAVNPFFRKISSDQMLCRASKQKLENVTIQGLKHLDLHKNKYKHVQTNRLISLTCIGFDPKKERKRTQQLQPNLLPTFNLNLPSIYPCS